MKPEHKKNIYRVLAFILGLILSGVVLLVVFIAYTFYTLDFTQELYHDEEHDLLLLASAFGSMLIFLLISLLLLRYKRKALAYGLSLLPLLVFISLLLSYAYHYNYHSTYDKDKWVQSSHKPFRMAASLVKDKRLISLTINELEDLLATPYRYNYEPHHGNGNIIYLIDREGWKLFIHFKNGKVSHAILEDPFLDSSD